MKVGILGGGLTGLTIAAHLHNEYEVLEKRATCGGHCFSIEEDGFTFDGGGAHMIFSRNKQVLDYMVSVLGENVRQRRRNNKIFYKGRYVKYPFENGLGDLDPEDRFECLYYYLRNDYPKPTNFKEWMYYTFGKGITEKHLLPYNEKVWNAPAELMSLDWVEGRVPKPPMEDVIKSAVGVETEGYMHQLFFYYPKRGGIESLPRAFEKRTRNIWTNTRVQRVVQHGRDWLVYDGKNERRYDALVSTIPIQDLIAALDNVPDEVRGAVNGLRYNSLITVALGMEGNSLPEYTAVYFPEREFKFNRISFPYVFSLESVPSRGSSVVAEITANAGDGTWEMTDDELIEHVESSLDALGIVSKQRVCYRRAVRSKYAYIVNDLSYRRNIATIREYVARLGIILCGRFSEFEYINMDVCVKRGMSVARRLNEGRIVEGSK